MESKKLCWLIMTISAHCFFLEPILFGMQPIPQQASQPAVGPVPPPAPAAMTPAMSSPAPTPMPAMAPSLPVQPVAQPASYQTAITQIKDKLKTIDTFKNTLKELVSQADDIAKKCKTVIKESRLKRIEIRKTADEKAATTLYADIEKNAQIIKTLESDLDTKTKESSDISQKIKALINDVNALITQLETQGVTFKAEQVQKEEKEDAAKELPSPTKEKKQIVQEPEKGAVKVNELQPQESYAGYVWRKTKSAFVGVGRFCYTTWVHTKDYFFAPSPAALPAPGVPPTPKLEQEAKASAGMPQQQPSVPAAPATPAQPVTPPAPAQPAPDGAQPDQAPQDTLPPESMPIASAGVPAEASDIDGDTQRIESRYQALNKDLEICERKTDAIQKTLASNQEVYKEVSDYQSLKDSIKKATNKAVDVTIDAAEKTGKFAKRIYQEKIKPFAQHVVKKVNDQFADTETPKEQQEHIEKPITAPQMPVQ